MSLRSPRVVLLTSVAGLAAVVLLVVGAASPVGAIEHGRGKSALLDRCVRRVLGVGRSATPVTGSADPQVVSHFAIFRQTRSDADALAGAAGLRRSLAAAGASTYDPSAAVRLTRTGSRAAVYAVPARTSVLTLPAGCSHLRQFAGVGPYLALQAQETGTGPGVCLISTQLEESAPSGVSLPGAAAPKPTKTLTVANTVCQRETVLSGYVGALGDPLTGPGARLVLVADGVSAITYTLANGELFTVSVARNLATAPTALSIETTPRPQTAGELRSQLAAHLPTTVIESGTASATLTRPVSLIPDIVGDFSFLGRLLNSSVSSTSSTSTTGASCSAHTHRCVAVTVTTTCDSNERCRTTRTILHYRYIGARPPAGTTGPDTQPTAPIVARTNRFLTRPRNLTLVLSGTAPHHVVVLLSVSCFARNSGTTGGGSPLRLAVPSRTPIALPGPARSFHACDVAALVTSSEHSSIHVTITRG